MLEITIKLTASDELLDAIRLLAGVQPTAKASVKQLPAETKQETKREEPVKETKKVTKKEATEEKAPAGITLEQVRAAIQEKASQEKRDAIKELLKKHGVERATELKADQYSAFLEDLKEI